MMICQSLETVERRKNISNWQQKEMVYIHIYIKAIIFYLIIIYIKEIKLFIKL